VVLSEALVDREGVGELVARWNASHPDTANDRRVVLSVDAVSFRPHVTIADDGSVEGLEDIRQLDSPDIFEQYLLRPKAFTAFLDRDEYLSDRNDLGYLRVIGNIDSIFI
jgi:hypothetical protein